MISLGDNSLIEYSNNDIPFSKVQPKIEKLNSFSLLKDITENIATNETVNVVAYASLRNSQVVDINTQYGVKRKKDVELHEDSEHIIKLTLWNNHIDLIDDTVVEEFAFFPAVTIDQYEERFFCKKCKF